jgi:hypothetical protein
MLRLVITGDSSWNASTSNKKLKERLVDTYIIEPGGRITIKEMEQFGRNRLI